MLKSLSIKNFALIENLELNFHDGLNIITGETGAGKSIIVDALMLALGDRGSPDYVRQGENKATIEAEFILNDGHPIFNLIEINELEDLGNTLLLRRELTSKGMSRCFLNDSPVQLNLMKQIGDMIVDFHGQHDHQILLKKEYHLGILDNYSNLENDLIDFQNLYNELKTNVDEYKIKIELEKSARINYEKNKIELEEINRVNPQFGEEEELEQQMLKMQSAEFIMNLLSDTLNLLDTGTESVHNKLTMALKNLEKLTKYGDEINEYVNECNSALISISEISLFLKQYISDIDFSEEKIEQTRLRLLELKGLRKKYGSYDRIRERKKIIEEELQSVESYEESLLQLGKQIKQLRIEAGKKALKISEKRQKGAINLSKSIIENLKFLGIENGNFHTEISQKQSINDDYGIAADIDGASYFIHEKGIDNVEFFISTNKGEPPKPLQFVASGGEISRIMLSIKSIAAKNDFLPILVFDEIDIGISGRIAQKVGIAMKKLSSQNQIIAITHLAQIAALADINIFVEKIELNGKTIITAKRINDNERIKEVARLISGEKITDAALKSAKELMNINLDKV